MKRTDLKILPPLLTVAEAGLIVGKSPTYFYESRDDHANLRVKLIDHNGGKMISTAELTPILGRPVTFEDFHAATELYEDHLAHNRAVAEARKIKRRIKGIAPAPDKVDPVRQKRLASLQKAHAALAAKRARRAETSISNERRPITEKIIYPVVAALIGFAVVLDIMVHIFR